MDTRPLCGSVCLLNPQIMLVPNYSAWRLNNLPKITLDSAVTGIEPAISNPKSKVRRRPNHYASFLDMNAVLLRRCRHSYFIVTPSSVCYISFCSFNYRFADFVATLSLLLVNRFLTSAICLYNKASFFHLFFISVCVRLSARFSCQSKRLYHCAIFT